MALPSGQDYNEAIQNPNLCFEDYELKTGSPQLNSLGLPKPITGGFASVYQINNNNKKYAVRCFIRYDPDQEMRYKEISNYLKQKDLQWMVDFSFLKRGIKVGNQWFPILKMEWVDGVALNLYVEQNLQNPAVLQSLANDFAGAITNLQEHSIAHGDLQHGNILISNGLLRLIDYDGMYVPNLRGMSSHEVGHPNYQHPKRRNADFGPSLDNFSAWVIYISLIALSIDPTLWQRTKAAGDDALLLRQSDFDNPYLSSTIQGMAQSSADDIRTLVTNLRSFVQQDFSSIPALPRQLQIQSPTTSASNISSTIKSSGDWLKDYIVTGKSSSTDKVIGSGSIGSSWIRDHIKREPLPTLSFPDDLIVNEAKAYQDIVDNATFVARVTLTLFSFIAQRYTNYPIFLQKSNIQDAERKVLKEKAIANKSLYQVSTELDEFIKRLKAEVRTIEIEIENLKKNITDTHITEAKEIALSEASKREKERFLQERLKSRAIRAGEIERIGQKRITVLYSVGIHTASDITPANKQKTVNALNQVHGADGYSDWRKLERWRNNVENIILKNYTTPLNIISQEKQVIQAKYQYQRDVLATEQNAKMAELQLLQQRLNGNDPKIINLQASVGQAQKQVDEWMWKQSNIALELAQYSEITLEKFLEKIQMQLPKEYHDFKLVSDAQKLLHKVVKNRFIRLFMFYLVLLSSFIGIFLLAGETLSRITGIAESAVTPTAIPTPTSVPLGFVGNPILTNTDWIRETRTFDGFEMVLVPTGCFTINWDSGGEEKAQTQKICFEKPFWVDKYEVTNEQFGSTGYWSEPDLPRERVNWFDAAMFCAARDSKLPTELEWEYVARGPDNLLFPWGNDFVGNYLNYDDTDGKQPLPVGSYSENITWVGAYDMSGNVWEWTSSIYLPYPYDQNDGRENLEEKNLPRVLRGGGFETKIDSLKLTARSSETPEAISYDIGFRCVRPYQQ